MSVAEHDDEKLLHHPPLRERVRDRLELMIIDGVYRPGEHLVETDLAKRLGVSRGPVREALHLLHIQGWVDLRPRQGAFVHQPSAEEVANFFHVRGLLEVEAASLALDRITAADLDELRDQIKAARRAIARDDAATVRNATAAFHGRIHRLAGNPVLLEMVSLLDKRLRWYNASVAMDRAVAAWDEHEQLVVAMEKKDRRAVISISRAHNSRTREAYLRHARKLEATGVSRPGFVGGSEPCEGGSHASTEEVSRRVA
jgi:DNA-binding GntR family transcriptional regulator